VKWNSRNKILPTVFYKQPFRSKELMPSHWNKAVLKPAFLLILLTEVFEAADIAKVSTQYKTIVRKELLLQEFMPEIQTVGETC
jgi:hypothetical protein